MTLTRTNFLPRFSAAAVVSAGLLAMAPGCSSSKDAVAQVGLVWTLSTEDSSKCPVAGSDTYTIGGGGTGDSTVANGGTTSSGTGSTAVNVPVSVTCTVSGSDSSGYQIFLYAVYGSNLASFTVPSQHIDGAHTTTTTDTPVKASFNDNLPTGFTSVLSQTDCTLTYPNANNGIAPGRIWAHLSCPNASDGKHTCDSETDFRFENCTQ